jgi:acyl carrier protein
MSDHDIQEKVIGILAGKLKVDRARITPSTLLAQDLGVDSFGALEIMFEIEEAFAVAMPDCEIEKIRTVTDIVNQLRGIKEVSGGLMHASPAAA